MKNLAKYKENNLNRNNSFEIERTHLNRKEIC